MEGDCLWLLNQKQTEEWKKFGKGEGNKNGNGRKAKKKTEWKGKTWRCIASYGNKMNIEKKI